jgi:hypothetical protein
MNRLGQMITTTGVLLASTGIGVGVGWFLKFLLTGEPQV